MLQRNILAICVLVVVIVSRGVTLSWITFRNDSLPESYHAYAEKKLLSLRNLRDKFNRSANEKFSNFTDGVSPLTEVSRASKSETKNEVAIFAKPKEEVVANFFKNIEPFLMLAGPLKKMISSKQGIKSLISIVIPKSDVLSKLLDISGSLEPTLKGYLTDKYNGLLTSLMPYGKNIGVPPLVLDSMKISPDFDNRWQLIRLLLNSKEGMENFIHSLVKKGTSIGSPKFPESRSADETDLISDQEPDASGQAYRKQQQLYLSSFKKRLMMPGAGRIRLISGGRPGGSASIDYDSMIDQNGEYGQVTYDVRAPEASDTDTYYSGSSTGDMDMTMSATGGRGHGHSHSHGHGHASYGGFLDPFTILGGLAFLTYLGLMLQNSLNRNGTNVGRSLTWDSRLHVVPISLQPIKLRNQDDIHGQQRTERALAAHGVHNRRTLTANEVVKDLTEMWKQLIDLKKQIPNINRSVCERQKLCALAWKLKEMNMEFLLDVNMFVPSVIKDEAFMKELYNGNGLSNLCRLDLFRSCETKIFDPLL